MVGYHVKENGLTSTIFREEQAGGSHWIHEFGIDANGMNYTVALKLYKIDVL